jgi:hypothetical protein
VAELLWQSLFGVPFGVSLAQTLMLGPATIGFSNS